MICLFSYTRTYPYALNRLLTINGVFFCITIMVPFYDTVDLRGLDSTLPLPHHLIHSTLRSSKNIQIGKRKI